MKKTLTFFGLCLASSLAAADSPIGTKPMVISLQRSNHIAVVTGSGASAVFRLLPLTNALGVIAGTDATLPGDLTVADTLTVAGDISAGLGLLSSSLDVSGTAMSLASGYYDGMLIPASNLTNYTVTAQNSEWTLNMTNAVRFTLAAGGVSGQKLFPCVTLTNYSGATQTLNVTNAWKAYGPTTNQIPSGKVARLCFEVEGSNVRYSMTWED